MSNNQPIPKNKSRRDWLKRSALVTSSIAFSTLGLSNAESVHQTKKSESANAPDIPIFYGKYQSGIITEQPNHLYLLSLTLLTDDRTEVIQLLKSWTKFAELKTSGVPIIDSQNTTLPPNETSDADDLGIAGLTITFGFGPDFFSKNGIDRYNIAHNAPKYLHRIPPMPADKLNADFCDGDLCVQVCAQDQQVAFHIVRNFIRLASGFATPKWLENGFISSAKNKTARNLFGFKDGTANTEHTSSSGYDQTVWSGTDEPEWLHNGSYLAYRKVQMFLEVWDRSSANDHDDTFGRYKHSGAAYGQQHEFTQGDLKEMPVNAHVRLAKETGQRIHRRAYSYSAGVIPITGAVDAGLLFIAFSKNPQKQLIPMLNVLGLKDRLNEYAVHIGSALFACPRGIEPGEYIGQSLFES